MTDSNDLETRMRHLEEQITALAEDVDGLSDLVKNFLGQTAELGEQIRLARRAAAGTDLREQTNAAERYPQKVCKQSGGVPSL